MMEVGVCSAGFSTTVLPAASAGASFQAAMRMGKFQGMICPITPIDHVSTHINNTVIAVLVLIDLLTQGLVQADGHGVAVQLADGSLLAADHAREVAEVVHHQGQVSRAGLANRLAE